MLSILQLAFCSSGFRHPSFASQTTDEIATQPQSRPFGQETQQKGASNLFHRNSNRLSFQTFKLSTGSLLVTPSMTSLTSHRHCCHLHQNSPRCYEDVTSPSSSILRYDLVTLLRFRSSFADSTPQRSTSRWQPHSQLSSKNNSSVETSHHYHSAEPESRRFYGIQRWIGS